LVGLKGADSKDGVGGGDEGFRAKRVRVGARNEISGRPFAAARKEGLEESLKGLPFRSRCGKFGTERSSMELGSLRRGRARAGHNKLITTFIGSSMREGPSKTAAFSSIWRHRGVGKLTSFMGAAGVSL